MVAVGSSFVTEEKRTYFNGILGSRKVGRAYRDPYNICFFLIYTCFGC
jgi:hypothetical protein